MPCPESVRHSLAQPLGTIHKYRVPYPNGRNHTYYLVPSPMPITDTPAGSTPTGSTLSPIRMYPLDVTPVSPTHHRFHPTPAGGRSSLCRRRGRSGAGTGCRPGRGAPPYWPPAPTCRNRTPALHQQCSGKYRTCQWVSKVCMWDYRGPAALYPN